MSDNTYNENNATEVESRTYKCPGCGNFLRFDPDSQKLKCEYCGFTRDLPEPEAPMEICYTPLSEQGYEDWGETKCIKCAECGAQTILSKYQTTTVCPFCGAPNIVESDELPGLKPNAILPFRLSETKAHESLHKWMKKKFLAPSDLRKLSKTAKMSGIYVPAWTFDTYVTATYRARFGEHYTVTVGSGKNRRTVTHTRWYTVSGSIDNNYNDIVVEAGERLTQPQVKKLGGFDTLNSVKYNPDCLAGYSAERYDTSLDEGWKTAQDIIVDELKAMVRNRYPSADVVDYINVYPIYNDVRFKYVMMPIWVSAYRYKGKDYGFVVNARNGKTIGKAPLSAIKTFFFSLFCAGVGAVLIYLIYLLFFS